MASTRGRRLGRAHNTDPGRKNARQGGPGGRYAIDSIVDHGLGETHFIGGGGGGVAIGPGTEFPWQCN
jgi:hypothetical protein